MGAVHQSKTFFTNFFEWLDTVSGKVVGYITKLGILFGAFVYINVLITDFKEGKETLNRIDNNQNLTLQVSKLAIRSSKACYWRADSTGKTVEVGPEAEALTGWKADILMDYGWFNKVIEKDKAALRENMQNVRETGGNFFADFTMIKPDSTFIHIHSEAFKVLDSKGKVKGWVGTLQEIE